MDSKDLLIKTMDPGTSFQILEGQVKTKQVPLQTFYSLCDPLQECTQAY
jgi:hypothetical protein